MQWTKSLEVMGVNVFIALGVEQWYTGLYSARWASEEGGFYCTLL